MDPEARSPEVTNDADITAAILPLTDVNVRDFGARGDGHTDNTDAFDAALAAIPSAGGTLYVPAGIYMLRPTRMGAIELSNRSNITIAGEGLERSILRAAPATYSSATHVILLQGVANVVIRDLTLDGNEPNASYNEQQSHGIEVRNSSNLRFERMRFMRLHGDGVRLVGRFQDIGAWTERVVVKSSRFEDNGRSGVGMQRAVRQVQILDNTFEGMSDQSISSEPGGRTLVNVAPRDILMEGNVIRARGNLCVALEGPSTTDVAKRLVFRNNRVENGAVKFRSVDDLRIEGNVIIEGLLELPSVTDVQVVGNEISGTRGEALIEVTAQYDVPNAYPSAFPSHLTLSNNRIRASRGRAGILVRDALGDVTILENEVYGEADSKYGIQAYNRVLKGSPRSGFIVIGNRIQDFVSGIKFASDGDLFAEVVIAANSINHDQTPPTETVGIFFAETGPYRTFASVTGNVFGAGIKTKILVRNP